MSRLMTAAELAREVGVRPETVRRWAKDIPNFPVVRLPGLPPRFRITDVSRFIDRNSTGGGRIDRRIKS